MPSSRKRMRRELPECGRPLVMGVVNVTPDSFFDGGRYFDLQRAVDHALRLIDSGADIVDVGGESTRPGSLPVPIDEELRRIGPVIEKVRAASDIFISIDTMKHEVAREALDLGADMVNDVSGFTFDEEMANIVRDVGAYGVVMHMKGSPKDMQAAPFYDDVIVEITAFFAERIGYLEQNGIDRRRIILDPGIGFGKRVEDNLRIIRMLGNFKTLGMPLLVGTSMKSFISKVTGGAVEERCEGTLASVAIALWNGADMVRVHDVAAARRTVDIVHAIMQS
jgi:dihydropteroate synthase